MRSILLLVTAAFLGGGCTMAPHHVEPSKLQSNGLLVGSFVGDSIDTLIKGGGLNLNPKSKGSYLVRVDGRQYRVLFYNDIFLLDLPPGEYESIGFYDGRKSFTTKLGFTIKPGKITSLGGIYPLFVKGSREGGYNYSRSKYRIFQIDNESLIRNFLIQVRSDLYEALHDKTLYKSGNDFFTQENLVPLQRRVAEIAAEAKINGAVATRPDKTPAPAYLVEGVLGVAGWVDTTPDHKPGEYRPLPITTMEHVKKCAVDGDRFACILGKRRTDSFTTLKVLEGRGDQVREVETPDVDPITLHLFGDNGIALMDENFKSYIKPDGDSDWKTHQQPDKGKAKKGYYHFANTEDGYYTYYHDALSLIAKNFLTYTPYKSGKEEIISLPNDFGNDCSGLLPTGKGLIVGPDWDFVSKSSIYVRADDGQWSTVELPQSRCHSLTRGPGGPDDLFIKCAESYLRSNDGGYTWTAMH